MNIVFFGSTDDSVIILEALIPSYPITAIVTQQAKPVGRKQIITPTPVDLWVKEKNIPILTFPIHAEKPWRFAHDDDVANTISSFHPDLIITACFGERIPKTVIEQSKHGGVNVHPSLLPRWRGAYPVPWAILAGDAQTGVTISTITEHFDDGRILAQKKIPITPKDMPHDIRKKLFTMGAELLVKILPEYISGKNTGIEQRKVDVTTAHRLTREHGFVPWNLIASAMDGVDIPHDSRSGLMQDIRDPLPQGIVRLYRALSPWPGIWTTISIKGQDKRLKILSCIIREEKLILQTVQLEGKQPVEWNIFKKAYFT